MLFSPQILIRRPPARAGSITFTPTDNPVIQFPNFGSSVITFTSANIGTASSDRIVIVGVTKSPAGRTISSITVGGTALTQGVNAGSLGCELWYGNISSGTSANIVVTYNAAVDLCGILVGSLTGQSGGGSATPSATNSKAQNSVADPQTFASAMTVPAGGIGIVFSETNATGAAASWTSTTSSAGDYWVSTSSGNTMNVALAHTITSGSWNPSVSNMGQFAANSLVALAWNP